MVSAWLIRRHRESADPEVPFAAGRFDRLRARYEASLAPTLRRRGLTVGTYVVVTALIVGLIGARLGTEIFPRADGGQMQLRIRGPAGTNIEKTETTALRMLETIKQAAGPDNVALTLAFVGVHAPNYPINLVYQWNGGRKRAFCKCSSSGVPASTWWRCARH